MREHHVLWQHPSDVTVNRERFSNILGKLYDCEVLLERKQREAAGDQQKHVTSQGVEFSGNWSPRSWVSYQRSCGRGKNETQKGGFGYFISLLPLAQASLWWYVTTAQALNPIDILPSAATLLQQVWHIRVDTWHWSKRKLTDLDAIYDSCLQPPVQSSSAK